MKILILGGTGFLGRTIVEHALSCNHQLTLFNRGTNVEHLSNEVEVIVGDRRQGLSPLGNRKWDAVIDTWGLAPNQVRESATALSERVEKYIYVSSVGVYRDFSKSGATLCESSPTVGMDQGNIIPTKLERYSAFKDSCEQWLLEIMPNRSLILRCGLIVGPHMPLGAFPYWLYRLNSGGDFLVPLSAGRQLQFIDSRDLIRLTITLASKGSTGIYNLTGPLSPVTAKHFFTECASILNSKTDLIWPTEQFIKQNLEHRMIRSGCTWGGGAVIDCRKAIADGLEFRPFEETVSDTNTWFRGQVYDSREHAGYDPEVEKRLLSSLDASNVRKQ